MKPSQAALEWAVKMRFSALAGNETIISAYEAHQRLLAKIAARKKRPNVEVSGGTGTPGTSARPPGSTTPSAPREKDER